MFSVSETGGNTVAARLILLPRWQKMGLMVAADLVALPLCFLCALTLRLGSLHGALNYGMLPYVIILAITIPVFVKTGLYRAVVRFIDSRLLATIGIGLAGTVAATYLLEYAIRGTHLPRTALLIYWFIAFVYVTVSRLLVRFSLQTFLDKRRRKCQRVAIYGAGHQGAELARAIRFAQKYTPVCFFDDKRQFQGRIVSGIPVFDSAKLAELVAEYDIRLIVLAIPDASPARLRDVLRRARHAGVEVKVLNKLVDLADAKASLSSIRAIRLEDLLGREPVPPYPHLFTQCVQGKAILVTGAGGSIGSELCRQIISLRPSRLDLLDHSEYALYKVQQDLQAISSQVPIHAHLGSVCDGRLVNRIVRDASVETIYHAAAYKHVPLVETNIAEGVLNNVVGARVVAAAALQNDVETCVLISTDKAVRPTNIMGATKRIAELIFQAAAEESKFGPTFCMVRFGNVLGSSGSVIPLFQQQIERGGPVTITHPEITRYFMLIPEAAQLVIQAGAMAKGGDVFVLDMGEPVRITDLARSMIEAAGLNEKNAENPDGDIEIQFVGLRPGEKLYEELLIGDHAIPSEHPRIMTTCEHSVQPQLLETLLNCLIESCRRDDQPEIARLLKLLVQEYAPQREAREESLKSEKEQALTVHTPAYQEHSTRPLAG